MKLLEELPNKKIKEQVKEEPEVALEEWPKTSQRIEKYVELEEKRIATSPRLSRGNNKTGNRNRNSVEKKVERSETVGQ